MRPLALLMMMLMALPVAAQAPHLPDRNRHQPSLPAGGSAAPEGTAQAIPEDSGGPDAYRAVFLGGTRCLLEAFPGTRLLFASGYDPRSVNQATEGLGQADLLMKPFGIPDLLGKVREILDR